MPPEPLRTLRTLHAQHRHRDCATLALGHLSSVDASASASPAAAAAAAAPATTETADSEARATTAAAPEPLHRAALALYAALSLDALARSAPLRSASAAARAARAAELFAWAAAALEGAYGGGDGDAGEGGWQGGEMIVGGGGGGGERERDRGCESGSVRDWTKEAETAPGQRTRVERFRRDVAEFVEALEALGRSADGWRNKVLDWQERHGVVVSKEELAAAAWDLHGRLW